MTISAKCVHVQQYKHLGEICIHGMGSELKRYFYCVSFRCLSLGHVVFIEKHASMLDCLNARTHAHHAGNAFFSERYFINQTQTPFQLIQTK